MAGRLALSVSQLNEYVRRMFRLDPVLQNIELKGEISNLKFHQNGMLYFTLKDEDAAVSCVMYEQDVENLTLRPFEGMRVSTVGSVSLYVRGGQYQFCTKTIKTQGVGVLYERLLELKSRLSAEGLFLQERKKPLPVLPETIGVVTSPTGAVIHDILNVSLRRDPDCCILLYPVRVQGTEAAEEVVQGIRALDAMEQVDVIIVARGGGSMEDLWTFNEEAVVRAVADCSTPVISAVGHETDVTLCDLAADFRAPTPSAAAECAVSVRKDLTGRIADEKTALREAVWSVLRQKEAEQKVLAERMRSLHPKHTLELEGQKLERLKELLYGTAMQIVAHSREQVEARKKELALLNPYALLERGYSIVLKDGHAVSACSQLRENDLVRIRMRDGTVSARIGGQKEKQDDGEKDEALL